MKYIYPAVFSPLESGGYYVEIPDLPNCQTEGKTLLDAYDMAQDVIAFYICDSEDHGEKIPPASDIHTITHSEPDFVTLISVDVTAYRASLDNKAVRTNVTIPNWLKHRAETAGINFSEVLTAALKTKLNIPA